MRRSLSFILAAGWSLSAGADFSDDLPATLVKPTATPTAAPQSPAPVAPPQGPLRAPTPVAPPADPKVVPSPPAGVAPTPAPLPTPQPATTGKPTRSSGDFLSGDFFSDVSHDTTAPVNLENSESLSGSRDKGQLTLSGNVLVTQSDLRMKAEAIDLVIDPATNKFSKVLARGKVHVQKPVAPGATEYIEARAAEMEYQVQSGKMKLKKQAKVTRGKDCNLAGDILEYDLTTGNVSGRSVRGSCLPPPDLEKKP